MRVSVAVPLPLAVTSFDRPFPEALDSVGVDPEGPPRTASTTVTMSVPVPTAFENRSSPLVAGVVKDEGTLSVGAAASVAVPDDPVVTSAICEVAAAVTRLPVTDCAVTASV